MLVLPFNHVAMDIWDKWNINLLAMIGSGLVPTASEKSQQYRQFQTSYCSNLPSISNNELQLWVSSPPEMLVLPFNHVAPMDMGWVKHNTIGNDWDWFGLNSFRTSPTVGKFKPVITQISLASQTIWSSCESPHHLKCLFCLSIMLLWMWDESNTALLAMIGSSLVPTA